ncbi:MAG: YlmH/Sll1252 family protein, partial [Acetanaerobacterium sp.]
MDISLQQDKILAARVADAVYAAQNRYQSRFIGFLGEHEASFAAGVARSLHHPEHRLFGGYEDAKRVFLGIFSPYDEQDDQSFPIFPVTFLYRRADSLTHRDFLGAMLSLGLARESVGDILISEGSAVVFATESAASLVIMELVKVGGTGVKAQSGVLVPLETNQQYDVIEGVVASERLDCVVALVTRLSREKAAAL